MQGPGAPLLELPFGKGEGRRPSTHSDMGQRRGKWKKGYETTKVAGENEDTGRAILETKVPEFISAIPLPLKNPKQVKEPKQLNQVKVKFQNNTYPRVR